MTNIFSIIEDVAVTKEDLLEAELFAEQFLSSKFPSYDFRQGTAVRDMTIRPNAVLLAAIKKAMAHYFEGSNIADITDATDGTVVDKKLSDFFVTRKEGSTSRIRTRLFFQFPQSRPTAVLIPRTAYFSTDNSIKFNPVDNVTIGTEPGSGPYFQLDSSEGLWFVDLDMVSEGTESKYNLEEGDLLYFSTFSPFMVKGQILYLREKAVDRETNTEMVARAYTAVSTRNLVNNPSIAARIQDVFSYVKGVETVGLGDDFMYRDRVTIDGTDLHIGGHVDVLLNTDIIEDVRQYTVDGNGNIEVMGPVLSVERGLLPDGDPDTVDGSSPFTVATSSDNKDGLSSAQRTTINLRVPQGSTATFKTRVLAGVGSVQDWMDNIENRVVLANYLARSFEPTLIRLDLKTVHPFDKKKVYDKVKDYVESIPNGGTLYKSGILQAIADGGLRDFNLDTSTIEYQKVSRGSLIGDGWTALTNTVDTNKIGNFKLFKVDINE